MDGRDRIIKRVHKILDQIYEAIDASVVPVPEKPSDLAAYVRLAMELEYLLMRLTEARSHPSSETEAHPAVEIGSIKALPKISTTEDAPQDEW